MYFNIRIYWYNIHYIYAYLINLIFQYCIINPCLRAAHALAKFSATI